MIMVGARPLSQVRWWLVGIGMGGLAVRLALGGRPNAGHWWMKSSMRGGMIDLCLPLVGDSRSDHRAIFGAGDQRIIRHRGIFNIPPSLPASPAVRASVCGSVQFILAARVRWANRGSDLGRNIIPANCHNLLIVAGHDPSFSLGISAEAGLVLMSGFGAQNAAPSWGRICCRRPQKPWFRHRRRIWPLVPELAIIS